MIGALRGNDGAADDGVGGHRLDLLRFLRIVISTSFLAVARSPPRLPLPRLRWISRARILIFPPRITVPADGREESPSDLGYWCRTLTLTSPSARDSTPWWELVRTIFSGLVIVSASMMTLDAS